MVQILVLVLGVVRTPLTLTLPVTLVLAPPA